jgi:hypothetical protein
MSQFERGLGLNMLFLEQVCMACCGCGIIGLKIFDHQTDVEPHVSFSL